LLAHITLKQDQRFIAAWLAGSYARGEQQWFSDLDWMIAASNVQNFLYGDLVQYQTVLRWLEGNIRETRAALRGERTSFTKASRIKLSCTREEQIATLRPPCDEMESLMPQVNALGGYVPASPRTVMEKRLALLE
jgi:hypothetical protein